MGNEFRSYIRCEFDGLMCVLHACLCLTCVIEMYEISGWQLAPLGKR